MDLEAALAKIKVLEGSITTLETGKAAAETKVTTLTTELASVKDEAASRRVENKGLISEVKELKKTNEALKDSSTADETLKAELVAVKEERDTFKFKVTEYTTAQKAILDTKLAVLTDDQKKLVPDFGEDTSKTMAWLTQAEAGGIFGKNGIKPKAAGEGLDIDVSKMTPKQKMQYGVEHPNT